MKNSMEEKITSKDKSKRKLTESERKRTEIIKTKVQSYVDQGYSITDLTIDLDKANRMALFFSLPFIVIFFIGWYWKNGFSFYLLIDAVRSFPFILALIASIAVHELIHGFFWGISAEDHFKSIEFGMAKITPYCTCLVPLADVSYIIGGLAPGVILGVLPCLLSVPLDNFCLFELGVIQLLAAGGDLQIAAKLIGYRSSKKNKLCIDHPTEIGLLVLEK